ncbi:MAG: hypothetical protein RLZZ396_1975, partial [Planctomycetota bacterium]
MHKSTSSDRLVLFVGFWLFAAGLGYSLALAQADSALSDSDRIDALIQAGQDKASIKSADVCSDAQFVRRIYIDLAGRIPTLEERQSFLDDPNPNKRTERIDRILQSEDYVQNFADTFDALLMGRAPGGKIAERKKIWRPYLENVFRNNRPWDQVAREILLARPQTPEQAGAVWFLYERNDNAQAIAEALAPAFFGIRIDCAQCHDHMIASEIHQQHYWGLVAFFNRSKNQKTNAGPRIAESAIGGFSDFANIHGSSYPNILTFFEAKTIDEARPQKDAKQEDSDDLYVPALTPEDPRVPKFSRRERFVEEVLAGHPRLAQAFVNRIWAMLLGRGIVHPFDQMDSAHPASHPELLKLLAKDFVESGYDIRRLVRRIASSRTYQLSSLPPAGAQDPSTFAWSIERPLSAEQLVRSIQIAIDQKSNPDHPILTDLRDRIPEVMPETITTDISDALFLSNNPKMHQMLLEASKPEGFVSRLASNSDPKMATKELFLRVLGREASNDELDAVLAFVQKPLSSNTGND